MPVPGNLDMPGLGLSSQLAAQLASTIDVIYHSGATVNWIYPYERLKAPNVLGTLELLRLATRIKLKPVHFVSSLGVFPLIGMSSLVVVREDDTLDHGARCYGGYVQSKWVADKLVQAARARGVPVCIYRPGLITGHSETGAWNPSDVTSRMLRSWIELEAGPGIPLRRDGYDASRLYQQGDRASRRPEGLCSARFFILPIRAASASGRLLIGCGPSVTG